MGYEVASAKYAQLSHTSLIAGGYDVQSGWVVDFSVTRNNQRAAVFEPRAVFVSGVG